MKIILISTSLDIQAFGLRTVSSCLKKAGHEVKLIFLPQFFWYRYSEKVLNGIVKISRNADFVGISLMTNNFDNAIQLTKRIKKDLKLPVIWGGIHPTIRPEECLEFADVVCVGEGEETVVELARKMEKRENFGNIKGLWLKKRNKIIKNPVRLPISNLDLIPFQDYDYKNHYILHEDVICQMDDNLLSRYSLGIYMTIPTRGCPFGCSYCCNNTLNKMFKGQKPVRQRSLENVIKELEEVKDKLPMMTRIKFDDDAFFVKSLSEIKDFSQKYREKIGLPLIITGANPLTLTREKLASLVDAGLDTVRMGIQTGSSKTKKLYGRHETNEQVLKAVKLINHFKNKIKRPVYDVILDNPWEEDEDLIKTLIFLSKFPSPYVLQFFSLTFYPETALYQKAKDEGLIQNDLNDVYRKYFHSCQNTFLNSLFVLLNEYGIGGGHLSPRLMSLVTNQKLRNLRISSLIFYLFKLGLFPSRVRFYYYLLINEAIEDIKRGDWHRITQFVRQKSSAEKFYKQSGYKQSKKKL